LGDLPEIVNWRRLSDNITLSGQPSEQQLSELRDLGVSRVINLGPHTNRGALDDEATVVAALGMAYTYIPVDFANPSDNDFIKFCDAIDNIGNDLTHVHCIYNARVSAFFYRYAHAGLGFSISDTFTIMDSIWRPGGVWAKFIGNQDAVDQPIRYSGEDY